MGRSETESLRSTRVDFWSGKTLFLEIIVTDFSKEGIFVLFVGSLVFLKSLYLIVGSLKNQIFISGFCSIL